MEKENEALWTSMKAKWERSAILILDAFVGGMLGGCASAVGSLGMFPDMFNFGPGLGNLCKQVLWAGFVSAGLYLRQRPESSTKVPPSSDAK